MLSKHIKSRVQLNSEFCRVLQRAHARIVLSKAIQAPVVDVMLTDSDDTAAKRLANLKVASFSSQQYVKDFLTEPLTTSFPKASFLEPRLDQSSAKLAEGCEAVVAFVNDDLSRPVIDILAGCGVKLISMRCAGYDRVDLQACQEHGIRVTRVPTYSPSSVAEHAVALMFALNRNIHVAYNRTQQGNYSLNGLVGFEMKRKTVGVIGTGAIGFEACRILKGLGCTVLAHDLYPNATLKDMGVTYMSVEDMLPLCDIVSLHCPLLPSTRQLINKERLALMKPGAMLINVSRGGLVASDALFDALESGHLGALGMDVYENEDSVFFVDYTQLEPAQRMKFWDRKFKTLLTYPQVLVTPHSAFLTREALSNIASTTITNITNYALGKDLGSNEVQYKP